MKIIHLSDLHLGYRPIWGMGTDERFDYIVEWLASFKTPQSDYAIVITGDTVDNGKKEGSHERAKAKIDSLAAKGFPVFMVPGNHDCGSGFHAERKYSDHFKAVFKEYLHVVDTFPTQFIHSFSRKDGGTEKVAFIGLDSMEEELEGEERKGAEGDLGNDQRDRLSALLKDAKIAACDRRVVLLHHHPFNPRPFHHLKDAKVLKEVLLKAGNVDALIFGHNHEGLLFNGLWGIPRCYDGGSSTVKGKDDVSAIRVMDLSLSPRLDYCLDIIAQMDFDMRLAGS